MRFLKQIFIGLLVFAILLFGISLLLPSSIDVSKSVLVYANHQKVNSTIADLTQWKNWNPILQDPQIRYEIATPQQVSWKSRDGIAQEITLEQAAPDSISITIRSDGKQVFTSGFNTISHQQDSLLTKVEWWISEDLKWYPWQKFYGLFAESFRDAYMENTLQSLKDYLEFK